VSDQPVHLSLYRRWRPQRFAEIVGQEEIVRTLRNAVTAGEVSHAYLFAGERGIGKTSIARILARAVNCMDPHGGEPCNVCSSCKTILAGRSLDILEIDGASNRGIDHIRKLREEVNFSPTDLTTKVYIIDEVHMLTNEAFNALLKTLEEPPAHAMFIFATTEPHKLPRTIVSRCQAFEFRRLSPDRISGRLSEVAAAEGIRLTDEARELIARRANGGMRDALVMLEQAASYEGTSITEAAVLDMLGLASRDTHSAFIAALEKGKRDDLLAIVESLVERGKDLELFLTDVIQLLRERIVAGGPTAGRAVALARGLLDIKADLFRALDRQILLEIGVLTLSTAAAPPTESPADTQAPSVAKRPEARTPPPSRPKKKIGEPEVASGSADDRHVATDSQLAPDMQTKWREMLESVELERIAIAAYLTEAAPSVEGTRLILSFHPEHTFHKESLEKTDNMQYLAGATRRHFGDAFTVEVRYDEKVVRKPLPREVLLEKAQLICEVFDGKIVKEAL
jgi:DNA polymerase-3 subunit gamma/tau